MEEKMSTLELLLVGALAVGVGLAVNRSRKKHVLAAKLFAAANGKKTYTECVREAIDTLYPNSLQAAAMR